MSSFETQTAPTDAALLCAVEAHRVHLGSNKQLLVSLKAAHPGWIIGKKRVSVVAQAVRQGQAAACENQIGSGARYSASWRAKATALDSPVAPKNIIEPARRVAAALAPTHTNWKVTAHALSPGSDGCDSDWEAPERLFLRPGSGLKPTTPDSLQKARYEKEEEEDALRAAGLDDEEETMVALHPRTITFVPNFQPEDDAADELNAESVALKEDTLIKLRDFFDRKESVGQETKERVVNKLQGFFDRPTEPVLPLARIESEPAPAAAADDGGLSCSALDAPVKLEEDGEDTACNVCTVM
jgi:hypothetical protein